MYKIKLGGVARKQNYFTYMSFSLCNFSSINFLNNNNKCTANALFKL